MLLSCVTLGLPGVVIYNLSRWILTLVYAEALSTSEMGISSWPLLISINLLWPWGITCGYLLGWRLLKIESSTIRWRLLVVVTGMWAIGVAVALYPVMRPDI
jgi:hypothetical protein